MITISSILLALASSVISGFICYRIGFRRGVILGSTPDVDFFKNIKLPTSGEIYAESKERYSRL
jgi:ABC-type cobalt transport system substrate-binding protein